MMGKNINDPMRLESQESTIEGLGFFDMETVLRKEKILFNRKYKINNELGFFTDKRYEEIVLDGYEIHNGVSSFNFNTADAKEADIKTEEIFSDFAGKGIISISRDSENILIGTYVHGLFENDIFRNIIVSALVKKKIKNKDYRNKRIQNLIINENITRHHDFYYKKIKNYNFELLAEVLEKNINMTLVESIF